MFDGSVGEAFKRRDDAGQLGSIGIFYIFLFAVYGLTCAPQGG